MNGRDLVPSYTAEKFMKHGDAKRIESRPYPGRGTFRQGDAMCDLCDELNCQIEKCRKMAEESTDELMREALATLIISYEEDKTKLHLNPNDGNDDR
jgi:hypothetical protein